MRFRDRYRTRYEQFQGIQRADAPVPADFRHAGANARIPPDVRSILDVGCGDGQFLHTLSSDYLKVGVDIAWGPLTRLGHPAVQAAIEALPFPSASFDLVTCFEVLEHLPHYAFSNSLREVERVSRKYIIVSVPNREILSEALVWCRRCSCGFNPSWHVRSFGVQVLAGLFREFTMMECRECGPETRYGETVLAALAAQVARRPPPPGVACPQCGYSAPLVGGPSDDIRRRPRWFGRRLAARVLFRVNRPYWLLAFYARTATDRQAP